MPSLLRIFSVFSPQVSSGNLEQGRKEGVAILRTVHGRDDGVVHQLVNAFENTSTHATLQSRLVAHSLKVVVLAVRLACLIVALLIAGRMRVRFISVLFEQLILR